ncbi:MAG: ribonucleoside triphosphate reductase [Candidatus Magasanikbacteria bacterium]|jgi:ribonucleoside-triphosphate reductase (formate)|nr:ribonucleoside triphosphate reductase [Candidatus Magasanikbacteria bacterium]MBT4221126.1 ribonucleoside triphosphate reductase [Candidatus Magasanikbacteria bacterium]MBT4350304.1 ribonucleoside triphosphate reductase [Candidatus Magasanikbacteria bacterium]MBT4541730.1 ribonucleoside triphosphate reductase [Candidatus Magasanikbacteria bacterium]MBT6253293.1 ribonucleoside triphosphate reductase [Candidatus Magasanikbacteria bacterium]
MPVYKVQKRNGSIVDFTQEKIEKAIRNAARTIEGGEDIDEKAIAKEVYIQLEETHEDAIPSVEHIQDVVEEILIQYGYGAIAKAYILYREKRREARAQKNVVVEVEKTIGEYLGKDDWRVQANSNQGYSLGGMILNTSGKVTANYWLSHIYPSPVGDAHRNADLHIHDLDMFSGYCAGWSLRALLEEGFNGIPNKIESGPPKHLSSAIAQMVNFLGTLQNEWAGAQAFSSLDTYLAPFVKKYEQELREELKDIIEEKVLEGTGDKAIYRFNKEVEEYIEKRVYEYTSQNMQSFVFNLNIPSRWGTQTPFTNITLDWTVPDDLKDKELLLGGKPFPYTFGELQEQMDVVNKAFIDVMVKGDVKGRTFTFPIPTYNITKEFDWEDEKTEALFEMTAKYGTPYFQNFINSDLNPGDVRSMCCRLQLDLKELRKRGGGLFGSAEMTGSIGVVTINAARIGYTCRGNKAKFLGQLHYLMQIAKVSLEIKRKEIQKWMDRGLFPFTKRYLGSLGNHFSTIGINGVNEAIRNFTDDKENITTKEGQQLAKDILDFMRDKLSSFQEETGHLYNLEATPAEGTTYRFAKEDKKRFEKIYQAGTDSAPYYTNSSQIPVGYTDDVFEALELQDELQTKYTGGTVLHCYMNERISSPKVCGQLVKKILTNFKLPYITISPTFSICPKHGYLKGEHDFCPTCDTELGIEHAEKFDKSYREIYTSTKAYK